MEISDEKKPCTVYHVKVEAYSSGARIGRLIEKNHFYSNIFFTHKEAYEAGLANIRDMIRRIYEASDYYAGEEGRLTLEDFMADSQAWYDFTVMEIDLQAIEKWKKSPPADFCIANRPPYLEYSYDHGGEMLGCRYVYCVGSNKYGNSNAVASIEYRPGDELPGAGTKFKSGDLVRLVRPVFSHRYRRLFDTEQIFVVMAGPYRSNEGLIMENTYTIETVSEDGEYLREFNFDNLFGSIHESELQPCNAALPGDSPLHFLQRVARGEFDGQDEGQDEQINIIEKLENGEISFRNSVLCSDVPELRCIYR